MQKSACATILFYLLINLNCQAQLIHTWDKAMKGSGHDFVQDIEISPSGNVYVTGYFSGTIDFDPSTGGSFFSLLQVMKMFLLPNTQLMEHLFGQSILALLLM
jgi:hypothetical protein